MISPQLQSALANVTDLSNGYVFHPVVIQIAIESSPPKELPKYVETTKNQSATCMVEGCDRPAHARSMCRPHHKRYLRGTFSLTPVRELRPLIKKKRSSRVARKQAMKERIIEVMGGKCMLCGGVYPAGVYDFHHVFDKLELPSNLFKWTSAEKIALEISKCALLCANCHRIEHIRLRSNVAVPSGTWYKLHHDSRPILQTAPG